MESGREVCLLAVAESILSWAEHAEVKTETTNKMAGMQVLIKYLTVSVKWVQKPK